MLILLLNPHDSEDLSKHQPKLEPGATLAKPRKQSHDIESAAPCPKHKSFSGVHSKQHLEGYRHY